MNTRQGARGTLSTTIALTVLLGAVGMNAHGWSVTGTVKNTSGAALSGVAVTVKDSSNYSTTTSTSGNFELNNGSTAILNDANVIKNSSISVQVNKNELVVKSPRDGAMKLSLVDCSGRTLWATEAISTQGVARVPFTTRLGRGAVFLLVKHADGTEYKSVGWGPDGMHVASKTTTTASAAAAYPTLLFKKADFRDTSFIMTSDIMTNISVVMSPASTQTCPLPTNIRWQSSGILVDIKPDNNHKIVSVKDPTIQKYNGKYLIYCTVYNTSNKTWSMQFIQFSDFSKAKDETPYFMDQTAGFGGYKCAPELFYFEPQDLWYLIWQQQDPAYSTTKTPDNPRSWSTPKRFYSNGSIPGAPSLPIDYWPIADNNNFYLFFTGDDGKVYRSKTTLANFPNGFGSAVQVKSLATSIIFEGSSHYKVKGTANTYLHLVEGMGSTGRYFSAWTSEGIEGAWQDYKVGQTTPFARTNNVTYAPGVTDWSDDVSHGELLRDNPNQKQEVDPCKFQLLYQGKAPSSGGAYENLPYKLGLLTAQ